MRPLVSRQMAATKKKGKAEATTTAPLTSSAPATESKEADTNNTSTTTMAAAGRHVNGGDGSHFPMADLDNEVQVEARVD